MPWLQPHDVVADVIETSVGKGEICCRCADCDPAGGSAAPCYLSAIFFPTLAAVHGALAPPVKKPEKLPRCSAPSKVSVESFHEPSDLLRKKQKAKIEGSTRGESTTGKATRPSPPPVAAAASSPCTSSRENPVPVTPDVPQLLKNLHVHHATVNTPGGESTARTSPPLNRDDEVAQLKESLQNMVSVLSDSERRLAEEQNIKEKVMAEVKRLSQQNAMLREQARASSGSDSGAPAFNSKPTQVLGMEGRLTRAVQELEQERSQTAEVITELETKYAHQLSKLQVAEKDALRRLIRETERNKAQEDCIAALRDHIHKMLADVATTTTTDRRQRQRWIDTVRPGTKGSQEIQQILRAVQQEEGVHPSQPEEVVRCLWYRRKEVAAQLSLLQHYLAEIGLNTSKLPDELKRLLSEKMDMEQQIKNQAWEIHNRIRDRQVMENTLKERLASLTSKKNKLEAHVKTVAGQAAQLDAENKALKLNATSASSKADGGASSLRAEIETMQERLLVEVCKRQQLEAELQLITNKPQDNNLSHIANCTGTVDDAGTAKRLLHEREVELKSLQDVVRRQKLDIESLNTQLSSAQLQRSPLGGSREPNEADALVKLKDPKKKLQFIESQLHAKDKQLVAMETELRLVNRSVLSQEADKAELKAQLNNTSKDVQLLRDANITLERRFTADYDTFQKEKTESGKLKEGYESASKQLERSKTEQERLQMERDREHNSAVIMKDKCQIEESARMKVGEELEKIQLELSMYRHRLEASQESCSTLREERNSLAAEVHSLRQSLARQEARVSDVEQQYQQTLASTHNQSLYDVERLHKDRGSIEGEMKQLRRELEQTQGALRQAQAAVATHERTTERLQEQTLQSEALRTRAASLDTQNSQALGIIAELKAELAALTATNRHLQEKLEEVGIERKAVEARLDKQQLSTEVQLQHAEQKHHQQQRHLEEDKQEIVTRINKLLAQLHETEANLTTVTESKNHYLANQHMYEQELQSLKAQLQEEEAARRAGEERTAHVGRELELVRKQKVESHDKLCELQKHTSDLEAALQVEKNQVALLHEERATLRTSCTEQENYIRDLQQHIEQLQSKLMALKQKFKDQKLELNQSFDRSAQEWQDHRDSVVQERSKLAAQAHQLSVELEAAREQLAMRSRESLQQQEKLLDAEVQQRDTDTKLRCTQEALRLEVSLQASLNSRIQELEAVVDKVTVDAKQQRQNDSISSTVSPTRTEVVSLLQGLRRELQKQMDSHISSLTAGSTDPTLLHKRLSDLEGSLQIERSSREMDNIELRAVRDDNDRLRDQMSSLRKRSVPLPTDTDNRSPGRSRIEEINKVIARSQIRAESMMATTGAPYIGDSLRHLGASRDFDLTQQLSGDGQVGTGHDLFTCRLSPVRPPMTVASDT